MSLGPMEIGLLLMVMLFVFGPKRIPEIGKSIGEALTGFRKATKADDDEETQLKKSNETTVEA